MYNICIYSYTLYHIIYKSNSHLVYVWRKQTGSPVQREWSCDLKYIQIQIQQILPGIIDLYTVKVWYSSLKICTFASSVSTSELASF